MKKLDETDTLIDHTVTMPWEKWRGIVDAVLKLSPMRVPGILAALDTRIENYSRLRSYIAARNKCFDGETAEDNHLRAAIYSKGRSEQVLYALKG